jgi:hypothetical protein
MGVLPAASKALDNQRRGDDPELFMVGLVAMGFPKDFTNEDRAGAAPSGRP